mgnify:CR=1 FL=1
MRTEKNIILIRHAKWLWDNKLKKQSKECRKQAYENNNFRSTRNGKDNNAVESSRRVHTGRR